MCTEPLLGICRVTRWWQESQCYCCWGHWHGRVGRRMLAALGVPRSQCCLFSWGFGSVLWTWLSWCECVNWPPRTCVSVWLSWCGQAVQDVIVPVQMCLSWCGSGCPSVDRLSRCHCPGVGTCVPMRMCGCQHHCLTSQWQCHWCQRCVWHGMGPGARGPSGAAPRQCGARAEPSNHLSSSGRPGPVPGM